MKILITLALAGLLIAACTTATQQSNGTHRQGQNTGETAPIHGAPGFEYDYYD